MRNAPSGRWRGSCGVSPVCFDVFDGEGRYLGQPEVPARLVSMSVQLITEDRMYVIDSDELGVDYVVRLDILRSP